ncbi:hypothetical protein T296_04530 [Pantoea agglomerans Eh318]|jgi:uncharacterized protein YcfJ|uniref:Glycine zipper 2TM domain-containing protein n=2 Tax=Eukaryota TaxID=2759 RepID=A0ABN8CGW1_9STRA|nr:hypothetical protein T296_04530 [Pantoea agglomerans Eh318]CAD7567236.1 unnamed protein product [Timema californicum]CAH0492446.1 unnamed protein product [Peronospora farinosa]
MLHFRSICKTSSQQTRRVAHAGYTSVNEDALAAGLRGNTFQEELPVNKSMLAGIGIGVAAALGVAAVAGMNVFDRGPQYAQVLSATPIKESIKQPRQECRNVTLTHRRAVQDENRLAGSVLGAVAGGVLGHQFGGGRGRDVATVAGAVAGGYAGNQVQGGLQDRDTYTTTEQRCKTVYDKQEKKLGYDVTYKIGDQQGKIRMENDPGTRIPLDRNGQLVLNGDQA